MSALATQNNDARQNTDDESPTWSPEHESTTALATAVPSRPPSTAPSTASVPGTADWRTVKREVSLQKKKDTMNGPLYMQGSNNMVLVRRFKRQGSSPLKQFTRWFVQNQVGLSFNLLALLMLSHAAIPKARTYTNKFFTPSYYNPRTELYGLGSDDGYFLAFCIVLFTGLRAGTMDYVLAPMAKALGVKKSKDITRFSEQAWLLVYYSVFWSCGLYIYCTSDYFFNLKEMWTHWPNREISGLMKFYTLGQLSFWLQQILVINIEERRKDHWQMLTHHVITIVLIYNSYRYHFTKVGNTIMVLMDIVDIVLPLAKCFKYSGRHSLSDCCFGVFIVAWFIPRHIFFNMVIYSVWKDTQVLTPKGYFYGTMDNLVGPIPAPVDKGYLYPMEALWSSTGLVSFEPAVKTSFLSMLIALQGLIIMWFFMIVRVAIRVIGGGSADDPRSDDEADGLEDEEEEEIVYEEAQPFEEEVGVESINLKNWERRAGLKRQSSASTTGVSLPGHSDRKELLGRIGCDKTVD